MVALVRHFGDREDLGTPCGRCDVCAPKDCVGALSEAPSADEQFVLDQLLERIVHQPGQASGRLCRELLGEEPSARPRFERLLGGLVRGGQVRVEDDAFEKDGRRIAFHRLFPTANARSGATHVRLASPILATKRPAPARARPARRRKEKRRSGPAVPLPSTGASAALVASLRSWRLEEARRKRVPAFRILTNRALVALAQARPKTSQALRDVSGIGPKVVQTYERQLLALCAS